MLKYVSRVCTVKPAQNDSLFFYCSLCAFYMFLALAYTFPFWRGFEFSCLIV